jgi:integrase
LDRQLHRRLDEIGKRDVLDLIDDISDRGVPLTANKTFAALRTFYNWAIGRDILSVSPCTGLKKPADESSRERVLSDDELRWLWRACEGIGFPFGPIVRLLLLTGTRREEVRGLPERELNLTARVWTIAPLRTKNGNEHEVPLSNAALAVLERVPRVRNPAGLLFITIERIKPGHPQQNGRHERMHLTLKKEATRPPGMNSLQQQVRFDAFRDEFNTERPHEALAMKCPAELYAASPRPYAGLPEPAAASACTASA